MAISINYKDALFNWANLIPIRGKPTFKTPQNIWNDIKANVKAVYSNIGGVPHGNLVLVLTIAHQVGTLVHNFTICMQCYMPTTGILKITDTLQ